MGKILHIDANDQVRGSIIRGKWFNLKGKYTYEELDDMITNQGYIPVATVTDLNNIFQHTSRDGIKMGENSPWYNTYNGVGKGSGNNFIQIYDINLLGQSHTNRYTSSILYDGNNLDIYNGICPYGLTEYNDGTLKNIRLVDVDNLSGLQGNGILTRDNYTNGIIDNCYVKGDCYGLGTSSGGSRVGIVCGSNRGIIKKTSSSGTVTGGYRLIGGIAGYNISDGYIEDCHSNAEVGTSTNTQCGGISGQNNTGTIINCYSTGLINGSATTGGIVGSTSTTVINSYYNSETSGQSDTGKGEPKTTQELKEGIPSIDIYTDWDVLNTGDIEVPWDFGTTNDYPILKEGTFYSEELTYDNDKVKQLTDKASGIPFISTGDEAIIYDSVNDSFIIGDPTLSTNSALTSASNVPNKLKYFAYMMQFTLTSFPITHNQTQLPFRTYDGANADSYCGTSYRRHYSQQKFAVYWKSLVSAGQKTTSLMTEGDDIIVKFWKKPYNETYDYVGCSFTNTRLNITITRSIITVPKGDYIDTSLYDSVYSTIITLGHSINLKYIVGYGSEDALDWTQKLNDANSITTYNKRYKDDGNKLAYISHRYKKDMLINNATNQIETLHSEIGDIYLTQVTEAKRPILKNGLQNVINGNGFNSPVFTIENASSSIIFGGWLKFPNAASLQYILKLSSGPGITFGINSGTNFLWLQGDGDYLPGRVTPTIDEWQHHLYIRHNNINYWFINGTIVSKRISNGYDYSSIYSRIIGFQTADTITNIDDIYLSINEEPIDPTFTKEGDQVFFPPSRGSVDNIIDTYYNGGRYTVDELNDMIYNQGYIPVATPDELQNVGKLTSRIMGLGTQWESTYNVDSGPDDNYIQVKNIDLVGIDWKSIPDIHSGSGSQQYFSGIYDGNELIIDNLTGESFLYYSGTLKNTIITNVLITKTRSTDVASIISANSTNLDNVHCQGTIDIEYTGAHFSYVAGFMRYPPSITKNCTVDVNIKTPGRFIGGMFTSAINTGDTTRVIENCEVTGLIDVSVYKDDLVSGDYCMIGGILADAMNYSRTEIINCKSNIDIIINDINDSSTYIGGIVGGPNSAHDIAIKNSSYTGNIDVTSLGTNSCVIGGIISRMGTRTLEEISNCYVQSNITTSGPNVSAYGLSDRTGLIVTSAYTSVTFTGDGIYNAFAVTNNGVQTNCYYNSDLYATGSIAEARTTNQLEDTLIPGTTTYVDWDNSIWLDGGINTYPTIRYRTGFKKKTKKF